MGFITLLNCRLVFSADVTWNEIIRIDVHGNSAVQCWIFTIRF
jgi:hypothetical protein